MGTTFSIKYYAKNLHDNKDISNNVNSILREVNSKFSTYDKESEISKFNALKSNTPFKMSADFKYLINKSFSLNKLTDGRYDITIDPLLKIWGFYSKEKKIPTENEVKKTMQSVGIQKLIVKNNFLIKNTDNVRINLSSLAKGYAVDLISNYLNQNNITNYLVEIGGEIRTRGNKNNGSWIVGVVKPYSSKYQSQINFELNDLAIATSGTYQNYIMYDGEHYSHIIDPISGKPLNNNIISMTVITQSCLDADGLATALELIGVQKALKIADSKNLPVYIIYKQNNNINTIASKSFEKFVKINGVNV